MGHLENPTLTDDLSMARDFDLGISGPPMNTTARAWWRLARTRR
jgi:hypothetical protein